MFKKKAEPLYNILQKEGLTSGTIRCFRKIIYGYYKENARNELPWRHTDNPYHILVSEVMLQQTQIERVLNKYPLFIKKYRDFPSLARARIGSLYDVWQGMGYNRRALALKEIARVIVKPPYNGILPSDMHTLMTFPFVGQSTAGAVSAFAFHRPVAFIETNIRRVFIHFFFHEQKMVTDGEIIPLIKKTIDRKDPRLWYYALMDYGSALRGLHENPNRKSVQYKKQSPFIGSHRQMRGRILRLVREERKITAKNVAWQLSIPHDKIRKAIDQLCTEGFLKQKGRSIEMA